VGTSVGTSVLVGTLVLVALGTGVSFGPRVAGAGGTGAPVGFGTVVAVGAGPMMAVRVTRGCGLLVAIGWGPPSGGAPGGTGAILFFPSDFWLAPLVLGGPLSLLVEALVALAALALLLTAKPPVPCMIIRATIVNKTVSRYGRPWVVRLTLIFMAILFCSSKTPVAEAPPLLKSQMLSLAPKTPCCQRRPQQ
jgi:hypothetical protein